MEAGKELNARIAEEVMGWKVDYKFWTVAKPHGETPGKFWRVPLTRGEWGAFCPSTLIQDAKLVWEKFQFVSIETCADRWKVDLSLKSEGLYWATGETIEEATCLAALKAVE